MDRTERFYRIDQLINDRRVVSFAQLQEALEVSRATLKRDLEYMRSRLSAPIIWDRDAGGYRFEKVDPSAPGGQYELPGLWFNSSEVHALLTMQHLLANLGPEGILTPHIQPLMSRLNALLGTGETTADEVRKRVIIIGTAKRTLALAHFERVGSALLRRKRLMITYYARGTGKTTEREVSPQRLVHYRENWYLDAWCHMRDGLRNFAVDSIQRVEVVDKKAREVSRTSMDAVLGPGYGIFSGKDIEWATLKFSANRARWVSKEQWHPKQKSRFDDDGSFILEIPFADDRELLMDILKYGADVTVIGPVRLRDRVIAEIEKSGAGYRLATTNAS